MQPDQNRDPWERRGIERESGQPGVPDWTMLSPFGVVAFGAGRRPVERLLALQGAIARGVDLITSTSVLGISAIGRTALKAVGVVARWCMRSSGIKTLPGNG